MAYTPTQIDTSSGLVEQTKFVLAIVAVIWYTTVWLVSTLGNLQVCVSFFHCLCPYDTPTEHVLTIFNSSDDDRFYPLLRVMMLDQAQPHEI